MRNFIPVPITNKALNSQEKAYLKSIMQGLDEQVAMTSDWLLTEEARDFFINRRTEIDKFFRESGIQQKWNVLIESNAKNSAEYIQRFYEEGAKLGYRDLHRTLEFTLGDEKALYYLKKYNFELIKDVNTELVTGLRETLSNAVAQGITMPELKKQILELPLQPINGKLNVQSRAMMIARTEYGRARTNGRLQSYANYGVEMVEVITAGDQYVCDICLDAEEMNPYPITDSDNLPLFHPNCRCSVAPVINEPPPSEAIDDAETISDNFVMEELK